MKTLCPHCDRNMNGIGTDLIACSYSPRVSRNWKEQHLSFGHGLSRLLLFCYDPVTSIRVCIELTVLLIHFVMFLTMCL